MSFFDMFKGAGNASPDIARISGGIVVLIIYPFPYIWDVVKHGVVPDPNTFGTGYAAVILAVAAFVGGKDFCVAKANSMVQQP